MRNMPHYLTGASIRSHNTLSWLNQTSKVNTSKPIIDLRVEIDKQIQHNLKDVFADIVSNLVTLISTICYNYPYVLFPETVFFLLPCI